MRLLRLPWTIICQAAGRSSARILICSCVSKAPCKCKLSYQTLVCLVSAAVPSLRAQNAILMQNRGYRIPLSDL